MRPRLLPGVLMLCCLGLSSCETAKGLGRDIGNVLHPPARQEPRTEGIPLDSLGSRVQKKGMFGSRPAADTTVPLEHLSAVSTIEAVPQEDMEGATPVDVDGDGYADARYRQRD